MLHSRSLYSTGGMSIGTTDCNGVVAWSARLCVYVCVCANTHYIIYTRSVL